MQHTMIGQVAWVWIWIWVSICNSRSKSNVVAWPCQVRATHNIYVLDDILSVPWGPDTHSLSRIFSSAKGSLPQGFKCLNACLNACL